MAEKKKITKRAITTHPSSGGKVSAPAPKEVEKVVEAEKVEKVEKVERVEKVEDAAPVKRSCYFCKSKTNPSYTDLVNLKRYLTERAKIVPKLRSSLCSKHQRAVSKNIKYARHLSLLPFVPTV